MPLELPEISPEWLETQKTGVDPSRYVAWVTVEFNSPVLIGTGKEDKETDQLMLRDVHGLPLLPGSSLAGVLAHRIDDEALRRLVFGVAEKLEDRTVSFGSRLKVSDGYFHTAHDRPADQTPGALEADEVTAFGLRGVRRDRVRIGARGTSDGRGKFEYVMCPAGARFTFELDFGWGSFHPSELDNPWADPAKGALIWEDILRTLEAPTTRVGTSTRSGLGAFKVEKLRTAEFWLAADNNWTWNKEGVDFERPSSAQKGYADFASLPVDFNMDPPQLEDAKAPSSNDADKGQFATVTLANIAAEGFWMFGGEDPDSDEDITPLVERRIEWAGKGNLTGQVSAEKYTVMPASGIKGALSHRTLWHLRRLAGEWLESVPAAGEEKDPRLARLFGSIKSNPDGKDTQIGRAGRLYFEDVYLAEAETVSMTHNSIDRFTSGVRAGFLYDEKTNFKGQLGDLRIWIDTSATDCPKDVRQAFNLALDDLQSGWLQLGGGTGRGHGAMTATLKLDAAAEAWFSGKDTL